MADHTAHKETMMFVEFNFRPGLQGFFSTSSFLSF